LLQFRFEVSGYSKNFPSQLHPREETEPEDMMDRLLAACEAIGVGFWQRYLPPSRPRVTFR